jgi:hypothetical protein
MANLIEPEVFHDTQVDYPFWSGVAVDDTYIYTPVAATLRRVSRVTLVDVQVLALSTSTWRIRRMDIGPADGDLYLAVHPGGRVMRWRPSSQTTIWDVFVDGMNDVAVRPSDGTVWVIRNSEIQVRDGTDGSLISTIDPTSVPGWTPTFGVNLGSGSWGDDDILYLVRSFGAEDQIVIAYNPTAHTITTLASRPWPAHICESDLSQFHGSCVVHGRVYFITPSSITNGSQGYTGESASWLVLSVGVDGSDLRQEYLAPVNGSGLPFAGAGPTDLTGAG